MKRNAVACLVLLNLILLNSSAIAATYFCYGHKTQVGGNCGEDCELDKYFAIFDKNDVNKQQVAIPKGAAGPFFLFWDNEGNHGVTPDTGYKVKCKCGANGNWSIVTPDISVLEITGFQVAGATVIGIGVNTPSKTTICGAGKGAGDVTLTVTLNPSVSEENLPEGFITWTGGNAVTGHQLQRTASKADYAKHVIVARCNCATCENNKWTQWIYILGAEPGGFAGGDTNGTDPHFTDYDRDHGRGLSLGSNPRYARCDCEIEFSVKPDALWQDGRDEKLDTEHVKWTIKREMITCFWRQDDQDAWHYDAASNTDWHDDTYDEEEASVWCDLTPWDGNGHIYDHDGPGWENWDAGLKGLVLKYNAREWASAKIGAQGVEYEKRNYNKWHAFRYLKKEGETWSNDATGENEVKSGNIFWGTTPEEIVHITTDALPSGAVGQNYSATLEAEGGEQPYQWFPDLGDCGLPPGLDISQQGVISGTPTAVGTFGFTIQVYDNVLKTDMRSFEIVIQAP